MACTLRPMPLDALVDLVNGWGSSPRREAHEEDWPYPSTETLAGRLGAANPLGTGSDALLVSTADQLHPVFATHDLTGRVDMVDRLLTLTQVRPGLRVEGAAVADTWTVESADDVVLASAALALRDHLLRHPDDRLGTCHGQRCADVFVDASPSRQRRFCSVTCQNRARVAAFRRRHAQL